MKTRKALSLFFCTVAFAAGAATVSVDTAKLAAGSWALSDASLGVQHGDSVAGVTTYDVGGTPGFFAVSLKGGGTLFLAADDEMGPVLAFTAESAPDLSAGSPLLDLLERDIRARRGIVKGEKELDAAMPNAAPKARVSTTAGAKARAHFCVINDTHATWLPFSRCIETIVRLAPSCVIWNGDATNCEEKTEDLVRIYLRPDIERKDYAARIPYIFCPGNHDVRGMASRHLERIWLYRQPEERLPRDWDLGRNFAIRMGEIAMIGLDTAEDKLDAHPAFAEVTVRQVLDHHILMHGTSTA